jgi:hypothetical protein
MLSKKYQKVVKKVVKKWSKSCQKVVKSWQNKICKIVKLHFWNGYEKEEKKKKKKICSSRPGTTLSHLVKSQHSLAGRGQKFDRCL